MNDETLCTRTSLGTDLRALGVQPGMTVIMHASLRSLGWVCGGAVAVVQALLDVLGPTGTLVVPTQTGENSEPSAWQHPPVPAAWWPQIRAEMPAFDPLLTPSTGMGALPEMVRTWPGAVRSQHPHVSFAAIGHDAAALLATHQLEDGLGEGSPLRAIYDAAGWVLLLGVGYDVNTSLHLAQCRVPDLYPRETMGAALLNTAGERVWQIYHDIDGDTDDFAAIGAAFEQAHADIAHIGPIGAATARLLPQRDLIDFATDWLRTAFAARSGNGTPQTHPAS
ncbi:MAG: AAC(3) family N-acetyltransferase [Ktedonobacterales bacterium]|nr:AAC(3) family N-acetyltransferase [Ktedonobacterales bacterium]